jgi:hypothetical protein
MNTILFKRVLWPDAAGCGLVGHVTTTYDDLVKAFGEPDSGTTDGKTTANWIIKFSCGTVATIYDWKEPETPKAAYNWHVGGKNHAAVQLVAACLVPGQHTINRTDALTSLFV